jgi:endoglucanase
VKRRVAVLLAIAAALAPAAHAEPKSVVEEHGQLRVQGNRIVDQAGVPVQLRGMSLYWSQWIPKYYTAGTIKWLRDDWKITVVRAAMAVKPDGYEKNPAAERDKVIAVVDAAIASGIYVIIDYHAHTAQENLPLARAFFADMARRYGNTPNVLYEPYNEPLDVSWAKVLKPYHEAVIDSIREFDPDNIVIVGTRNWSQQVAEAAADPIRRANVAYTLHFYANTHGQSLRDDAQKALDRGAALFVTEYGTTDATGDGMVNEAATRQWWDFLDRNSISHVNWSVADIRESSAALFPGASPEGGWAQSQIKPSGILVRNELRARAGELIEREKK